MKGGGRRGRMEWGEGSEEELNCQEGFHANSSWTWVSRS